MFLIVAPYHSVTVIVDHDPHVPMVSRDSIIWLQVLLDDKRYLRLEAAARRRKVSVATVVRAAIDRDLSSPAMDGSAAGHRFLEAAPMEVGRVEDLLTELDELRGRRA